MYVKIVQVDGEYVREVISLGKEFRGNPFLAGQYRGDLPDDLALELVDRGFCEIVSDETVAELQTAANSAAAEAEAAAAEARAKAAKAASLAVTGAVVHSQDIVSPVNNQEYVEDDEDEDDED